MATKLEEFVARLHAEGVEAGKAEAEQLIREAQARAEAIVAEGEARARQRLAEAEARVEALAAQGESELGLAARDAVLQLRSTLTSSLESLLRRATGEALADPALLADLLKAVVLEYVRADARGARQVEIQVPAGMQKSLEEALLRELAASAAGRRARVDVRGELAEAGFEYRVDGGGTVEITADAVVQVLRGLVRPAMYRLLNGTKPVTGS